ncbi:hypothetical protein [Acinetobacter nosocomialis]|uniref:hypothetical protein n=1 Tax=Acinetobacter nosocomialis TaxID=106654 RepID=UPI0033A9B31C
MTEFDKEAFEKAYRKATMVDLSVIKHAVFDEKHNCYLSTDGNHKRVAMINGGLWVFQVQQSKLNEQAAEIKRLEYMLGDKGEHPQLKAYIDAEIHRRYEEKKASSDHKSISKEDVDQLIKEVLDDCEQNPNKYQRNLYKQVDELQKQVNELKAELKKSKGNSIAAFINGMCPNCGNEPLQGIVSDREGYSKLHCFNCGVNKYEWQGELNNKENNNG